MSLTTTLRPSLSRKSRAEREALAYRLSLRQPATAKESLERYRNEPVAFCREILGAEPWSAQREILTALAREPRVSVRSGNGSGKTMVAAWATLWFVLTRPGAIAITTAPTASQVRNLLWRRLRTAFTQAKLPLPGRLMTDRLELGTEWYAMGLATDEEVKFQGPHSDAGVLMIGDEASGLKEWIFSAMEGTMTEAGAKMLLIGNPNQASGTFYESQRSWPASQRFHISAYDTPESIIRREWIEDKQRDWGEASPLFQVRVLGNFPPQGVGALIALAGVEAAQRQVAELRLSDPIEIGVDMAAGGGDECVLYARQGVKVIDCDCWHDPNTMASAGRIAAKARALGAQLVKVDDIGIGKGTADQLGEILQPEGISVRGVNVGEAARDKERFYNRRSELFWALSERFQEGEIDIPANDDLLMDQLTQLRYTFTPRGQVRLESKDEMKKKRGANSRWQSPDRADALCLAFATIPTGFVPWVGGTEGAAMYRNWGQ